MKKFLKISIWVANFFPAGSVNAQWTNPTQAPTGGNPAAPINVGPNGQMKSGNLGIGTAPVSSPSTGVISAITGALTNILSANIWGTITSGTMLTANSSILDTHLATTA